MKEADTSSNAVKLVEAATTWTASRKDTILRRAYLVQAPVGLLLILLGWQIGHQHFHLIAAGSRTEGTIIRFVQKTMGNRSEGYWHAFMPVVRFQAGGQPVEFEDWMGTKSSGGIGDRVPVLYDFNNPSRAMIDRPIYNWMPWGPIFAVGVFLLLVALKGWLRARSI